MPLERKPVAPAGEPEYPSAEEYSANRRGFLWLLGSAATGTVGYLAYQALSRPEVPAGAEPSASVLPKPPVANSPIPPAKPLAAPPGESSAPLHQVKPGPTVQPQAQIRGDTAVIEPPRVQPMADVPGKVAIQQPVQPQAQPAGGIRAPEQPKAQPQAQKPGGVKAIEPMARPQIPVPGGIMAPVAPEPPVQPKANAKGGAGIIVRREPSIKRT